MGAVASRAGMSRELYQASHALFSGRGALANATIGACALFGAVCGSSLATAATMARVSVPEMRRFGYSASLAAGAVASGGTLGILIPPSVILVLYAIIAEASVPELFAAGLVPGIVLAVLHVLVVKGWVWLQPAAAPPLDAPMAWRERLRAMLGMWKLAVLFLLAVGGIYLGWFSPTEAAAVGAFGAIVIALATRTLDLRGLWAALDETVRTTAMLFFVMVGAFLFARFVVVTRLPMSLTETVMGWDLPSVAVLLLMVVFYLLLGCFLETVSMILITVPVFLPLIQEMGLSPVWFGVLLVVVAEVGLITPPVGLNIFVIRNQLPDIPLTTLFRGVLPFLLADAAMIALLIMAPALALWLPSLLYG
jgi:tripartite ATP-independent transporter DctM subunit